MKSSLGILRKFGIHKGDVKDKFGHQASGHFDELAQAAQDMQNMRNCYDSLLSAAAATANSAYEFSDSLREMGDCLLEKTAVNVDQKSGGVFSLLGNVQLELQKLVDTYRSHIFLTITAPSESLLNELRTVEEMKRQCDEKRSVYEYMTAQQKEKGKSKGGKGDNFTSQHLQTAHDQYEEDATLCVFRLKSLKQGQSRSLLTQVARHHAAQLNFFRKGLKSLEAAEPQIRMITEHQHIDYHFNGLDVDNGEGREFVVENDRKNNDDGELSFDYREDKLGIDGYYTSRNSMEQLEQSDVLFRPSSMVEDAEVSHGEDQVSSREPRAGSHSAPLFAEKKTDPVEKMRRSHPSFIRRPPHTYVLPTPIGTITPKTLTNLIPSRPAPSGSIPRPPAELPPPIMEQSGSKKVKRQAFSGPVTTKSLSTKLVSSGEGVLSPPRSELHVLPRPPVTKITKYPVLTGGYSGPLVSRNQEIHNINNNNNRVLPIWSNAASPLPPPPLAIQRSYSIPSRNQPLKSHTVDSASGQILKPKSSFPEVESHSRSGS